jgi:hypothetical protein
MITINAGNVETKVNQFTLENLTTERACLIGEGWENIKIDPDFKKDSVEQIVELIGGRQATKDRIKFVIRNTPVHAWFCSRIIYEADRKKWVYVAGQDHKGELQQIRNELKK